MNDNEVLDFYSEAENHFKALADSYDRLVFLHHEAGNRKESVKLTFKVSKYRRMQNYAHENVLALKELTGVV